MAGVPSARSGDRSAGADRDWRLSWERKEHDRRAFSPGPLLGAAVQRRVRQLDQRGPRRRSSWRSGVSRRLPRRRTSHRPCSRSAGPGPSSTLTSLWLFRYALPPPPFGARPPGWDGDRWRSVPRRWARTPGSAPAVAAPTRRPPRAAAVSALRSCRLGHRSGRRLRRRAGSVCGLPAFRTRVGWLAGVGLADRRATRSRRFGRKRGRFFGRTWNEASPRKDGSAITFPRGS